MKPYRCELGKARAGKDAAQVAVIFTADAIVAVFEAPNKEPVRMPLSRDHMRAYVLRQMREGVFA
jgi:hypothetical protein